MISTSGFHSTAHLLPALGLGRRYIASFFGDNYPTPRPNPLYDSLYREGKLEVWSLLSYVVALRTAAVGLPFGVTRSLVGTDLGAALAEAGRVRFDEGPFRKARVALVAPMSPDVAFVHGHLGDPDGNVLIAPAGCEGAWGALAARRGVIATVERVVPRGGLDAWPHLRPIPPHRILAVCQAPGGAHPQPLVTPASMDLPAYPDDFDHYTRWRRLAVDTRALQSFVSDVLEADFPEAAYRLWAKADNANANANGTISVDPVQSDLIECAARHIAVRVAVRGYPVVLAGIGQSFEACRRAKVLLRERGLDVRILVETGLYDVGSMTGAHPFLLARDNAWSSQRLSDIEDVLGVSVCGQGNRALGVVGAAQVDRDGSVNTTRLANGRFLVGSGGAADICAGADEVVVLAQARRLVERVDHVTSPGHRVRSVVTEHGVFTRDGDSEPWQPVWPEQPWQQVGAGESAKEAR